ncbi:ribosome hibernation-promoting factor, HPF/YfiA family [Nitrospirillum viridazoti]|uniref:Ribosome hibernation promoting factor n=1 Tax=Nitrospirillum amazonense TaxID=28077 RepID=A0A560I1G3_9PROT|nr:ribosome-associated translation inhibitor RaiA [Nitrospirillum amazonense]TWB50960.1 ribosomal subunit interface protein [Nitrospirillum amazonense]
MHIIVKGKQLDVGESLRTHVETTLTGLVEKYFSSPLEATVVLSREAHLYKADIQAHVGRGILLQAYAEATEPYPAFDEAAERVAKRLRRYKRRLRDHHQRVHGEAEAAVPARKYIINADAHDDEADEGGHGAGSHNGHAVNGNGADHHPMIIAEMQTNIDMLTVSEAVMRMDLADLPALLFRNRAHGHLNMVYRRPDGNVGWVDPSDGKAAAAH